MTQSPPRTRITLFADFTCPFSYATEVAADRIAARAGFELRARAFELHPSPAPLPDGIALADLEAARPLAEEVEVQLLPPPALPRTRKAHEAARFAAERGASTPMRRAIYRALWEDGADIGRIDVLAQLGAAVGLDATELRIALDIDLEREAVLADLELARRLRIARVPTLFVGEGANARVLQGARRLGALDEAIRGG